MVQERSMGSSQRENLWHKLCPKSSLEIPGRTWLRLLCLPGKAALLHTETGQFRKALDAGAFPGFYPLGSTSFISPCCSLSPDCSPELFLILPSPFCSPRWTVGLPCLPQMKQSRPFQSFPKVVFALLWDKDSNPRLQPWPSLCHLWGKRTKIPQTTQPERQRGRSGGWKPHGTVSAPGSAAVLPLFHSPLRGRAQLPAQDEILQSHPSGSSGDIQMQQQSSLSLKFQGNLPF